MKNVSDFNGFVEKLSEENRKQKIGSGIEKLFPSEGCGNPSCAEKCAAVFEIASKMGTDVKRLMENFLRNEIMPECGCMPMPFKDDERHPLKKCRFGYYYGEHPDKTDDQLEAASRRRKEEDQKKIVASRPAPAKIHDPHAGGDAADYSYDEDIDCDVHEDDENKLNNLRSSINLLLAKRNRTKDEEKMLQELQADKADLEARIKAYQVSTFKGFEKDRFQEHDELITKLVREFNNNIKEGIDGTDEQAEQVRQKGYLSANLVKSWIFEESGGSDQKSLDAWPKDPAQVNNVRDWSKEKAELGLKEPSKNNSGELENNLRAGIRYMARKGFISETRRDIQDEKMGGGGIAARRLSGDYKFQGWDKALERYHGKTAPVNDGVGTPRREIYREKIEQRVSGGKYIPIGIR